MQLEFHHTESGRPTLSLAPQEAEKGQELQADPSVSQHGVNQQLIHIEKLK